MEKNNLSVVKIKDVKTRVKTNFAKFLSERNVHEDWIMWLITILKEDTINDIIKNKKTLPDIDELFYNFDMSWKDINTLMLFDIKNTFHLEKYPMMKKDENINISAPIMSFHKNLASIIMNYKIEKNINKLCNGDYLSDSGVMCQYLQFIDTKSYDVSKTKQIKDICIDLNTSIIMDMLFYKTNIEIDSFHVMVFSNSINSSDFYDLIFLFDEAQREAETSGSSNTYSIQFLPEISYNTKEGDIEYMDFPIKTSVNLYSNIMSYFKDESLYHDRSYYDYY